ncbi:MAG TPA: DedA family protein [Spirochaetota bacterium]|nr:DedA family protein [Spirochaetota bacterium]HOR44642.1 DedA family protein [Spirochaetota bacterium]HPK56111.1 DedA family protein [Spirochaetota bacterium]
MEQFFLSILDAVKENQFLAYSFLTGASILENLIPPVPGDSVVLFGAILSSRGYLSPISVHISTALGGSAGFYFLFYFAHKHGRNYFIDGKIPFFRKEYIFAAEKRFASSGCYIVLINRFLPGVRSVISVTAGILNLSKIKVFLFCLISSFVWNGILTYGGYFLGSSIIPLIKKASFITGAVIIIIFAVSALVFFIFRKKRKKTIN